MRNMLGRDGYRLGRGAPQHKTRGNDTHTVDGWPTWAMFFDDAAQEPPDPVPQSYSLLFVSKPVTVQILNCPVLPCAVVLSCVRFTLRVARDA